MSILSGFRGFWLVLVCLATKKISCLVTPITYNYMMHMVITTRVGGWVAVDSLSLWNWRSLPLGMFSGWRQRKKHINPIILIFNSQQGRWYLVLLTVPWWGLILFKVGTLLHIWNSEIHFAPIIVPLVSIMWSFSNSWFSLDKFMVNLVTLLFALFLEDLQAWWTAHSFRASLKTAIPCEN